MTHRRSFRPILDSLEPRLVLSRSSAASVFAASGAYNDTYRQSLATLFAYQAAHDKAPVVFLGDSITAFWGGNGLPAMGTPAWQANFAPLRAEEYGVIGDQTENLAWRVGRGELAGKPKVVVLNVGINDILASKTADQVASGVEAVVGAIKAASPRTKVVMVGLTPTVWQGFNALETPINVKLAAYAPTQKNVTFVNPGLALLEPNSLTVYPGTILDAVHPTAFGYSILAAGLIGPVQQALGR